MEMNAIIVDTLGAEPRLASIAAPRPGPLQLLIAVAAAGLNPFDWQLADGVMSDSMPSVLPFVLGNDAVGSVVEIGAGVTNYRVGDRVFGQMFHSPLGEGTFAEFTVVPADGAIALLPASVSDHIGAALPTAALTALGLIDALTVKENSVVLIVGASGGVGSFATQIAAGRGFKVLATAAAADADRLRGFGAELTLDHHRGELHDLIADTGLSIDAIVDVVSDRLALLKLAGLVRRGGQILSTVGAVDTEALQALGVAGINFFVQASRTGLERLLGLIEDHGLVVPIETVIDLADVPAAIARSRRGGARGKTVIRVSSDA